MAAMIVLPTAITRLVYEGGEFSAQDTKLVATALLFFSFSLVFSGINLMLSRSFFSLQQPWAVTWLSLGNLVVNLVATVWFGIAAYVVYHGADWVFGRSVPGQLVSVLGGLAAGCLAYGYVVLRLELPEARDLERRVRTRLS